MNVGQTLRKGDYFGCRVWLDDAGLVRGVEAVGLLRPNDPSSATRETKP